MAGEDLGDRTILVIPIIALFFATGGALENMSEEIIALVPVLLVLTNRLGYRPIVAVAMSLGAAVVGSAFSPINPFQVGIAQKLAQLPLLSGGAFPSGVPRTGAGPLDRHDHPYGPGDGFSRRGGGYQRP